MKAKGIFFSIGLSLLAFEVLSLSATTVVYRQEMQDSLQSVSAMERSYNVFKSIESDLSEIVIHTSGIEIDIDSNRVTFTEQIPNQQESIYQGILDKYEEFALNNTDNIQLQLSEMRNTFTLTVNNGCINYTHTSFGEDILVIPSISSLANYSIVIVSLGNITPCTWNISDGNNSLPVSVNIYGSSGGCSNTVLVDPSLTNIIETENSTIRITINSGGRLHIENNQASVINVLTDISLKNLSENISIYIPGDVISISLPANGILRKGKVRIM